MAMTPFGRFLRSARLASRKTMYDMATALGMKSSEISAIESGDAPATDEFLNKAASYFAQCVPETSDGWHPVHGADDKVNGPRERGFYVVTVEPKDSANQMPFRKAASAMWTKDEGFKVPFHDGYRVIAWRKPDVYEGPSPFTAPALRDLMRRWANAPGID